MRVLVTQLFNWLFGVKLFMVDYPMGKRGWDINVWYPEVPDVDFDNVWDIDDKLTIEASVYVIDDNGATWKIHPDLVFRCTKEETAIIRQYRTDNEYGYDWWETNESLLELPLPERVREFLIALPNPYTIKEDNNA